MTTAGTDRQRLSAIAHSGSIMWGPISPSTIDALLAELERLAPRPIHRVIDLGCGPAELSRRLAERSGARVTAVDVSPFALDEARRRLASSDAGGLVELRLGDAQDLHPDGSFDVALCIGPGWATGGWADLVRWATGFVRPNGMLVLADGAWRRQPHEAELATLAMNVDDHAPSARVETLVREAGAEPLWVHRSTREEWDAYAGRYRQALVRIAREQPRDPLSHVAEERAGSGWSQFELLHDLLDFVLVICRRPVALPQSDA